MASKNPPVRLPKSVVNALTKRLAEVGNEWRTSRALAVTTAFRAEPRVMPNGVVLPPTSIEEQAYQMGKIAGAGEMGEVLTELLLTCVDDELDDEPSDDEDE